MAARNNLSGLAQWSTEGLPSSSWAGKLVCVSLPWPLHCVECSGLQSLLNPLLKITALGLGFVLRVHLLGFAWVKSAFEVAVIQHVKTITP